MYFESFIFSVLRLFYHAQVHDLIREKVLWRLHLIMGLPSSVWSVGASVWERRSIDPPKPCCLLCG